MSSGMRVPFDVEYLKDIIKSAGFDNYGDFVYAFNQRYPEASLTPEELLASFKFGVMERELLSRIGSFLDLNKDQFVKLILGDGVI